MPNTTANIRLFKPGMKVTMRDGRVYTVKYNRVIQDKLFVYFEELEGEHDSEFIDCEPTFIDFDNKSKL